MTSISSNSVKAPLELGEHRCCGGMRRDRCMRTRLTLTCLFQSRISPREPARRHFSSITCPLASSLVGLHQPPLGPASHAACGTPTSRPLTGRWLAVRQRDIVAGVPLAVRAIGGDSHGLGDIVRSVVVRSIPRIVAHRFFEVRAAPLSSCHTAGLRVQVI